MTAEGKASNSWKLLWKSWLVSKPYHCRNPLAGTTPHSWLCSSWEAAEHAAFPQGQVASVSGKMLAWLFLEQFHINSLKTKRNKEDWLNTKLILSTFQTISEFTLAPHLCS